MEIRSRGKSLTRPRHGIRAMNNHRMEQPSIRTQAMRGPPAARPPDRTQPPARHPSDCQESHPRDGSGPAMKLPESCQKLPRHESRKAPLGEPDDLRSCPPQLVAPKIGQYEADVGHVLQTLANI